MFAAICTFARALLTHYIIVPRTFPSVSHGIFLNVPFVRGGERTMAEEVPLQVLCKSAILAFLLSPPSLILPSNFRPLFHPQTFFRALPFLAPLALFVLLVTFVFLLSSSPALPVNEFSSFLDSYENAAFASFLPRLGRFPNLRSSLTLVT